MARGDRQCCTPWGEGKGFVVGDGNESHPVRYIAFCFVSFLQLAPMLAFCCSFRALKQIARSVFFLCSSVSGWDF